jgi:ABC-type polysaccharide/polyol phosphate transport system ATPase subunit
MVARLGFSIAIEADPDALLLDEILAVGDQAFRDKSRAKTEELINSGKSVVLVSHDMSMHERISNSVIVL